LTKLVPGTGGRNIALTLAYDGTAYAGWQRQPDRPSVQGELERALKKICNQSIQVIGASRTDAGAHALAQVVNFHVVSTIPLEGLYRALNSCLPEDIAVTAVQEAPKKFHARFSAASRTYAYQIFNQSGRDPFLRTRVYHVPQVLKLGAMRKAAKVFVGEHDFSSLCTERSKISHAVRHVKRLRLTKSGPMMTLEVTANGFVRGMIRTMVQALVEVGLGRQTAASLKRFMAARDRQRAPRAAPAHGLYLVKVSYRGI